MSIIHQLTTRKKFDAFNHVKCDYVVGISFSYCNEQIDIHVATVKPDGSALTHNVTPNLFHPMSMHYQHELKQQSMLEIHQQTQLLQGKQA
jgi:hypothetical protein